MSLLSCFRLSVSIIKTQRSLALTTAILLCCAPALAQVAPPNGQPNTYLFNPYISGQIECDTAQCFFTSGITTTRIGQFWFADRYGAAPNDFATDSAPGIQAALNAAAADGGGTVYLSSSSYMAVSTITIPRTVRLACEGSGVNVFALANSLTTLQNAPCTIYSKVTGTNYAVDLRGETDHVNYFQYNFHVGSMATTADIIAFVSGFTGRGVHIGDGTNPGPAQGVRANETIVGGFNTCFYIEYSGQDRLTNSFGDCTNGFHLDGSHDNTYVYMMEFWPFSTAFQAAGLSDATIASVADNGSNAWRITATAPTNFILNQEVNIQRFGVQSEGIIGTWNVTPISPTVFDLQGSVSSVIGSSHLTTSATTTANNKYVPVTSTANLRRGMLVTHANIPAGARITGVWKTRNAISIDTYPTASGAATATFESDAFLPGTPMHAVYSANGRSGISFELRNTGIPAQGSEGFMCSGCFSFGTKTAFSLDNAVGTSWTNTTQDSGISHYAESAIGVEFDGYSYNNYMQFSGFSPGGIGVYSHGTAVATNEPNTFIANRMFVDNSLVEMGANSVNLIVLGSATGDSDANFLTDPTTSLVISGSRFPRAEVLSTTNLPIWFGDAALNGTGIGPAAYASQLNITNTNAPTILTKNPIAGLNQTGTQWGCNTISCFMLFLNDNNTAGTFAWTCQRSGSAGVQCTFGEPIRPAIYTIATLPACNALMSGMRAHVVDTVGAAAPAFHLAVAGGGATAINSPVYCDAVVWRYH